MYNGIVKQSYAKWCFGRIKEDQRMKKTYIYLVCILLPTLFVSCKSEDTTDIPVDIKITHYSATADRLLFENLEEVENEASIIVEVTAKEIIDQEVSTHYSAHFEKELPSSGLTKRECHINRVYKGDVEIGDTITLLQDYYIWDFSDDDSGEEQQLITSSYLKAAVKNNKYLMFLAYDDRFDGYWPVCDYEGMFSIPSDKAKEKIAEGKLDQAYTDVYDDYISELHYLEEIYIEVAQKYFLTD